MPFSSSPLSVIEFSTRVVLYGILSVTVVIASMFPVFVILIVYFIVSPGLADSYSISPFLVTSACFSVFKTGLCTSFVSSPLTTAMFSIVPSTVSPTTATNLKLTCSPAGISEIH